MVEASVTSIESKPVLTNPPLRLEEIVIETGSPFSSIADTMALTTLPEGEGKSKPSNSTSFQIPVPDDRRSEIDRLGGSSSIVKV